MIFVLNVEIKKLILENFRNFEKKKIDFHPRLTLIIGANGSGKTNICEAIGILAHTKSFRARQENELLSFGKGQAKIGALFKGEEGDKEGEILFVQRKNRVEKSYFLNGVKKRASFFLGAFLAVIFNPLEIDFLFDSPSQRRYHLDLFLSFCNRDYYKALVSYYKVLERRNKILAKIAEKKGSLDELFFWDREQFFYGEIIVAKRKEFFQFLERSQKQFKVQYRPCDLKEEYWKERRREEIEKRVSLFGPHRDDFRFFLGGRDLLLFGSRGEQRLAVLALKLSELEFVARVRKERPVLVLDDIFSELDYSAQERVFKVISRQQTVITSTDRQIVKYLPQENRLVVLD